MENKLSFSVENVEIVKDNPNSNFATLALDFFASGENLHDLYVSEETLMRTAQTIKNCPLVWKYDEKLDDIYTHDKDEVPCGFVPETSNIESRKLPDGRTMLSVVAYVWKRYTGELLNFFKRDGGKKPVSVEMSVYEYRDMGNGLKEIADFKYEGITILGTFVTPAIPLASATVLSFSEIAKEYEDDFTKEFGLHTIDFSIPEEVKKNAQRGLELRKKGGRIGTSTEIASAKYLLENEKISPERIRHSFNYFSKQGFRKNISPDENIPLLLLGGWDFQKWAEAIVQNLDSIEANRKLREEMSDEKSERMEMNMKPVDEDKKTTDTAQEPVIEKMEAPEEKKEAPEEKKEEMEAPKENISEEKLPDEQKKKFEFPANFNMEKLSKMFSEEEEPEEGKEKEIEIEMAKAECMAEFANPSVLMAGMFAQMCKMADRIEKMASEKKVYMEEMEALKQFKCNMEAVQKDFEVKKTLEELSAKVEIPAEAKEEMALEAEKFALSDLEAWKTYCKAKSFEFAVKDTAKPDVVRVGLPFTGTTRKANDLWS